MPRNFSKGDLRINKNIVFNQLFYFDNVLMQRNVSAKIFLNMFFLLLLSTEREFNYTVVNNKQTIAWQIRLKSFSLLYVPPSTITSTLAEKPV